MAQAPALPVSPMTAFLYTPLNTSTDKDSASGGHQDAIDHPAPSVPPPPTAKIPPSGVSNNHLSTQPITPSSAHRPVDLNLSTALNSTSSSSPLTAANIPAPDFAVFNTDSPSPWLHNSVSPALPAASSPHQQSFQPLPAQTQQQDFVLFDSPQPGPFHNRTSASLSTDSTSSSSSQPRHSSPNRLDDKAVLPAVQNQRVAQLLQGIGHQSLSPASLANRFYASSASSSVSLNSPQIQQHKSGPARPPVPLFHQSISSVPQSVKMMNAADVDLDGFAAFGGGASTAFSSPALPPALDFNGSMSSSTSNLGTVSPQDLLVQDPLMSAPNSAALTTLTSPSLYNGSPDFDSFDVSPNFGNADLDGSGWFPLFPQDPTASGPEQARSPDKSPAQTSDDADSVGRGPTDSGLKRSAGSSPGGGGGGRHSSVASVAPRKRDKPLPPIVVDDPNDVVAMKRARNTLAARKSRERKAQRLEELEERIAKLEAERDHWKQIALSRSGAQ